MPNPVVTRQIDRDTWEYTDGKRSALVQRRGTDTGRYFTLWAGGQEFTIRRRRTAVLAAIRYVNTGTVWTDYRKGG